MPEVYVPGPGVTLRTGDPDFGEKYGAEYRNGVMVKSGSGERGSFDLTFAQQQTDFYKDHLKDNSQKYSVSTGGNKADDATAQHYMPYNATPTRAAEESVVEVFSLPPPVAFVSTLEPVKAPPIQSFDLTVAKPAAAVAAVRKPDAPRSPSTGSSGMLPGILAMLGVGAAGATAFALSNKKDKKKSKGPVIVPALRQASADSMPIFLGVAGLVGVGLLAYFVFKKK